MADDILFNTKIDVDYADAEKKLASLQKKIDNLSRKMVVKADVLFEKGALADSIEAELNAAKSKLAQLQGTPAAPGRANAIAVQEAKVKDLEKQYAKISAEVLRYSERLNESTKMLDVMSEEAKELASSMTAGSESGVGGVDEKKVSFWQKLKDRITGVGKETNKASKSASAFGVRLKSLISGAFIFNIISAGLKACVQWFKQAIQANEQTRIAFANLKGSLMSAVQPLIDVLLPVITKIFNILTRIVNVIATIFGSLFGATLKQSAAGASALNEQVSGAADGLGGANDNAKKLKRTLAGFDTLNILEVNTDEASGGGGGGGSVGGALFDAASGFEWESPLLDKFEEIGESIFGIFHKIWNRVGEFFTDHVFGWIKKVDFEPLLEGVLGILEAILELLDPIFDIAEQIFDELIGPVLKDLIEYVLPVLLNVVKRIINAVKPFLEALKPILSVIHKFLKPIFEVLGTIFAVVSDIAGSAIVGVLEIITQILEVLTPLIEWLGELLAPIIELLTPILQLVGDIAKMIIDTLIFAIKLLIAILTFDLDYAREAFGEYMGKMGENIKSFSGHFTKLKENAVKVWNAIKNAAVTAWNGIKSVWSRVTSFFQGVINAVKKAWETGVNAIGGFFTNIFNGIKTVVVNAMNSVIGAVESVINWCVDAINGFISGLNWVIQGLGKILGQNWEGIGYVKRVVLGRVGVNNNAPLRPNAKNPFPAMATGGVVPPNHEFLAMLGDNPRETEVVSPLSTMKQALAEALREAKLGGIQEVKVYLDGKQLASNTTKWQQKDRRAFGV